VRDILFFGWTFHEKRSSLLSSRRRSGTRVCEFWWGIAELHQDQACVAYARTLFIPGPQRNAAHAIAAGAMLSAGLRKRTVFKREEFAVSVSPSVWYVAAHRLIRMPDCYVYAGSIHRSACALLRVLLSKERALLLSCSQHPSVFCFANH
jgi:hypothetical protein